VVHLIHFAYLLVGSVSFRQAQGLCVCRLKVFLGRCSVARQLQAWRTIVLRKWGQVLLGNRG